MLFPALGVKVKGFSLAEHIEAAAVRGLAGPWEVSLSLTQPYQAQDEVRPKVPAMHAWRSS